MTVKWLVCVFMLFGARAQGCEVTLTLSMVDYPPFTSPSEPNEGLTVTALNSMLDSSDFCLRSQFLPPARLERQIHQGQFQLTTLVLTTPPEHAQIFMAQTAVHHMRLFRLSERSDLALGELSQLKNRRIGTLNLKRSNQTYDVLAQHQAEIEPIQTIQTALTMLEKGYIDYVLAIEATVWHQAESLDLYSELEMEYPSFGSFPAVALLINMQDPQAMRLLHWLNQKFTTKPM